MLAPIAVLSSQTASLTIVVFDAASATAWEPTKAAATKAMFTGHPGVVMRGLGKGEEITPIDVGTSAGFAFELEGKSGRVAVYRVDDRTIAFVAPPHDWWVEHHADHETDIAALFTDALAADAAESDDATELGRLELATGRLAAVNLWHKKVGAAQALAASLPPGGAHAFGDGYGVGDNGLVVDVGAGEHVITKRELPAPWDGAPALTVAYLARRR